MASSSPVVEGLRPTVPIATFDSLMKFSLAAFTNSKTANSDSAINTQIIGIYRSTKALTFSTVSPLILTSPPKVILDQFMGPKKENAPISSEVLDIMTLCICQIPSQTESFLETWEVHYKDFIPESRYLIDHLLKISYRDMKFFYGQQSVWKRVCQF